MAETAVASALGQVFQLLKGETNLLKVVTRCKRKRNNGSVHKEKEKEKCE
jgi:hypothetical protein